ncbi:MAG TPA: DUF4232 domain-containing protein [Nocardioidaceae bacterium]|nr:DUF4232 domain-containing protein [Nocardioidaceae bacterium]
MSLVRRVVGAAAVLALAAGAAAVIARPASASRTPACFAPHLRLVRAATEGALSHRYVKFRLTNTGRHACRLYGYPTFQYRDASGHRVGVGSERAGVRARAVTLAPGQHTRVTLGYVVPAVTLRRQCHAARVASVDVRLAFRPHVYPRPLRVRVCTTKLYRPVAYPAGF